MSRKKVILLVGMIVLTATMSIACGRQDNGKQEVVSEQDTPENQELELDSYTETHEVDDTDAGVMEAENILADGTLEITLDFNRGETPASNQYAVWIEDEAGTLVKTLYVTDFTIRGGYASRAESIPNWVAHADPSSMNEEQVDAISGATPSTGTYTYTWDGTDDSGDKVSDGIYTFCVEGTMYWSSIVKYQGQVTMGAAEPSSIAVEITYTEDTETNRDMIQNVTANYSI